MQQPITLVTGGCGFVGRRVVLRLLARGQRVWVVDDLSTGRDVSLWLPAEFRDAVTFLHDDVRAFFRRDLAGGEDIPTFDDVFHCAAVVGGRTVIDGDPLAVAADLSIDADLFAWAKVRRPRRLLYASSSAAYPVDLQRAGTSRALCEEDMKFGGALGQPDMTYGWSKMTGEYLARIAAERYGLHIACVRPFSGYGEDQDSSYPVPALAARAARREDPFTVWGTGEQERDFIHIDDCVEAMFLALQNISDGSAVNIGSGVPTSFRKVIAVLTGFAGYHPRIQPLIGRPVGVRTRYADTTRMRSVLGWEPKISLEEGLKRVYDRALLPVHA